MCIHMHVFMVDLEVFVVYTSTEALISLIEVNDLFSPAPNIYTKSSSSHCRHSKNHVHMYAHIKVHDQ